MEPLVSIVVPCYNQAQFLPETIASVQNQDFQDWECIIINDGSSDKTGEIASEITQKDNRFKLINTPDVGLSASRNAGIDVARGKYILPLDGDDKIASNYVRECVKAMENDPDLTLVYCEAEMFGEKNEPWGLPPFSYEAFAIRNIIFCTAMFRKQSWVDVGGYDESLRLGFEDYEFWISILSYKGHEGKVLKLPFVGFYYRVRSNSLTSRMISTRFQETKHYVIRKHYDFFTKYLGDITTLFEERAYYKSYMEKIQSTFLYKCFRKVKSLLKS